MKLLKSTLVALSLSLPLAAFAQSTPNIDQRQENQQRRIDQGVQSGSLTPQEAARLQQGQQRVQTMENNAKADGVVTPGERARIHNAQDTQNRRVARQKHDRQHDYNHDGRADRRR